MESPDDLPDKVRGRVVEDVSGCWLWTGPKATKYAHDGPYARGVMHVRRPDGRPLVTTVARVVLAHVLGRDLEPGEWALHKCDTPMCVRPSHLYAGSPKDNTADARRRGRLRPFGKPLRADATGSDRAG